MSEVIVLLREKLAELEGEAGNVRKALTALGDKNSRPRRKRKPMSLKARRALSKRMKAKWAAKRKEAK